MTTNSKLEELFETGLKEIYWSERHLANVLTSMANASTSDELKAAFEKHKQETLIQANRLEKVFDLLGLTPEAKHSKGLQGIFDEGWQVIDETESGTAQRDAALIIAAQKVEHYEIACYGSLITLAKTLNLNDIANILVPTLEEEKLTDLALTEVAESGINVEAAEEEEEDSPSAKTGSLSSKDDNVSDSDVFSETLEKADDSTSQGSRFTGETPVF